jgi:hypothetical protein
VALLLRDFLVRRAQLRLAPWHLPLAVVLLQLLMALPRRLALALALAFVLPLLPSARP